MKEILDPRDESKVRAAAKKFIHDPLGFVIWFFPWGKGELKDYPNGPRGWQREELNALGEWLRTSKDKKHRIYRLGIASGHGIGKGAFLAMLSQWAMATKVDCKGLITANTDTQLKTKTWYELGKWLRIAKSRHWFECESDSLFALEPGHRKTWRIDRISWNDRNPEAFAGTHNRGNRILIGFDEASSIPDSIWDVTEGALTDENTEIIWVAMGNPTRGSGRFKDIFDRYSHRWRTRNIDARSVDGTNKELFSQWIDDYGIDSDFVKVKVLGRFPSSSSTQFFPGDIIRDAMKRETRSNMDDPLIMSLDIARGGDDNCVFAFRKGLDARSIPAVFVPGSEVRDSMKLVSIATALIEQHRPDQFFYDGTGVGGPVGDRIRQLGHPITEIKFGIRSPDAHYANFRAYMYGKLKSWLERGGAIENKVDIQREFETIEYGHNKADRLLMESKDMMKRRGVASPDYCDALAMTLAFPVRSKYGSLLKIKNQRNVKTDWDPFDWCNREIS